MQVHDDVITPIPILSVSPLLYSYIRDMDHTLLTILFCFSLTKMLQFLLIILKRILALAPTHFNLLILYIDDALDKSKCILRKC